MSVSRKPMTDDQMKQLSEAELMEEIHRLQAKRSRLEAERQSLCSDLTYLDNTRGLRGRLCQTRPLTAYLS